MFLQYDKKDKRKYVYAKIFVFSLLIGAFIAAMLITNTKLPSVEEKFNVGIGFVFVAFTFVIATTKLAKLFVKFKSLGFIMVLGILFFFKYVMDTLLVSLALALIPLLLNDLLINPYFMYLNMTKYKEDYWKFKE